MNVKYDMKIIRFYDRLFKEELDGIYKNIRDTVAYCLLHTELDYDDYVGIAHQTMAKENGYDVI